MQFKHTLAALVTSAFLTVVSADCGPVCWDFMNRWVGKENCGGDVNCICNDAESRAQYIDCVLIDCDSWEVGSLEWYNYCPRETSSS
ncbi:uncharacterized protein SCHCODRAFT_02751792 [Schizophyllum commune H4-8]|uniref:uncharacterized protein n=1 Tax=Schizophyllum commune (strain H4-8 / FGSC 9210) TaxID=578458 RepID=UPI00215F8728|nr:uncharacterized protein SCHCODRAFT_02751792 [Schizophyllum commune H4-8]KAI5888747.1 hypothetical protein SCHCODRAFT_02751792 [Schizophyllum commune H4-8]